MEEQKNSTIEQGISVTEQKDYPEDKKNKPTHVQNNSLGKKMVYLGLIAIILLVPLSIVYVLISNREETMKDVQRELSQSVGGRVHISDPMLTYHSDSTSVEEWIQAKQMNVNIDITTEKKRRSVYEVILYNSLVNISGEFVIPQEVKPTDELFLKFELSNFKGLQSKPVFIFDDKEYEFGNKNIIKVEISENSLKKQRIIPFKMMLKIRGAEDFNYTPLSKKTSVKIHSTYPHPAFKGNYLPVSHKITSKGFDADWTIYSTKQSYYSDFLNVNFTTPANPYQQTTRSAKYGLLIITLVFVAGLFVEYITKRTINKVQYTIIGLSLILFYSLLLSFSEVILFGWAYLISALMTIAALTFYFRAILRNRSAYVLGGFISIVYAINYYIIQMKTFPLLTGSLLLFVLLCIMMYLTSRPQDESDHK